MDFEESDNYAQQTAGHGLTEPDKDYGASDVNNTDTVVSESGNVSNEALDTDEWSSKGQKSTRFKHSELETKFRLGEKRRRCNRLGRGDQAGSDINRDSSFNKYVRKAEVRFRLGRGVKKKLVQRVHLPTGSRLVSPDQRQEDAKTTTSTGSSARCDITSATPARHGEPSKDRRRSRTDQCSSERKNV